MEPHDYALLSAIHIKLSLAVFSCDEGHARQNGGGGGGSHLSLASLDRPFVFVGDTEPSQRITL